VSPSGRKGPRQFSLGKQLLFTSIIVGAFLVVAELGLRTWVYYFRTPYERYNAEAGRLELVPNVRSTKSGHEFRINSAGLLGPEFEKHPRGGVYRIIAVGDSCTFSDGLWRLSYPALLASLLNGGATEGRYEVLNAGIEGYDSASALDRIRREIVEYRPQLVVVYVGWNDFMKVDPSNAAATGRHAWLARAMERSYLVRAYRKLLFFHLRPLFMEPGVGQGVEGAARFSGFAPARYAANLTAIVAELRARDIKPVLLTLPTAVRAGMTREEIRRQNIFFPFYAGSYSVAEFLELHRAYNGVVRSVGARLDVQVLDLDAIFNERDKRLLFWDTMHPSRSGQRLIAESLYRALKRTGV
jgi:lysophospholipase L1-like esterase